MLRARSLFAPRLVGELIRRMTRREFKATAETVEDVRLCRKIWKGLLDEKRGRVKPARALMGS